MLKSLLICLTLTGHLESAAFAASVWMAPTTMLSQTGTDPNVAVLQAYVSNVVQSLYGAQGLPAYGDEALLSALLEGIDSVAGLTPSTGWCATGFEARIHCDGAGPVVEYVAGAGWPCSTLSTSVGAYTTVKTLAATQLGPGRVARYIVFHDLNFGHMYTHEISLSGPFWRVERFCIAAPNSVGPGANIYANGSIGLGTDNFSLMAGPVPTTATGIFYIGSAAALVPFGNGYRCIGGALLRLPPQQASDGYFSLAIPSTDPVASLFVNGMAAYFQAWYRDPAAGGANFNLSDGIEVLPCP